MSADIQNCFNYNERLDISTIVCRKIKISKKHYKIHRQDIRKNFFVTEKLTMENVLLKTPQQYITQQLHFQFDPSRPANFH